MSNPQHEPTMEEILASIRKIISEDTPEAAPAAPAPAAPAPASAAPQETSAPPQEDVLELTQEIQISEPPQAETRPEPAQDVVFETVEPSLPPAQSSDIFSDQSRKALEDTFNTIPQEQDLPANDSERTSERLPSLEGATVENVFERAIRESFEPVLENYLSDNSDAIIERMKPVIREWLDQHFPSLLEQAVRAEVERVAKARGTKR